MQGEIFWNATIEELKNGYTVANNSYTCLQCGETFESGTIYPIDSKFYEAEKAAKIHVKHSHPPMLDFFLSLGRVYTGLSQGQEEITRLYSAGHTDKEIVALTGANSPSTIRNQRFAIREKYKQAKILVALVELMEEQSASQKKKPTSSTSVATNSKPDIHKPDSSKPDIHKPDNYKPDDSKLVDIHLAATNLDERYAITHAEREGILKRYFTPDNKLKIAGFPAKEKRKIIIMQKIINDFETRRKYTEKEVNTLLKSYYEDYVSVRRAMIEYGFLDRNGDGTMYWVKHA